MGDKGIMTIKTLSLSLLGTLILSACTAQSAEHAHEDDHSHSESEKHADHENEGVIDHTSFGHMSAIYLCGDEMLQTTHDDSETKLAFRDQKIDVTRHVSVIDNAFAGESFKGTFDGQSLLFRGKGYDASLKLGDKTMSCEKVSCIPLGGPH